ncbi:MAG: PQQ-dependent dehydrogenase, methanol/ethanol family [Gemmatimonadetes bacterium]|nr:PQQ-dependent dehydrogenase, methanol/ethanol family [Gemmatimonadota bacterium]
MRASARARAAWSATASALAASLLLHVSAEAQVPYERLVASKSEPQSWLTYSGSYSSERYSELAQIDRTNVARLRVEWAYQASPGVVESSPIVADGIMYLTEPPSNVVALGARTGRRIWRWNANVPDSALNIGGARSNRGVAILDGSVFVGTIDARLVALDAESGAVRWSTVVADNSLGYWISGAPLAIDGKIIVGISGAEAGIRGFLDAYDARTGQRVWRTYTVPAPGEPGGDTWGGDSWQHGGGSTWLTGSYDPELDLIYYGTGNPGPDWNGDVRPGDNLYTCSLVAFDADTGEIRWYFQFTPHDTHDWDSNEIPVLLDLEWQGRPRQLVVMANRNAFYYVLDRVTGEFLHGQEYSKQTWAQGLDARGRPIVLPNTEPTLEGTLVWPSLQGATNWFSPSYSPLTELIYVPVRHMGAVYYKGSAEYVPGRPYVAGGEQAITGDDAWGYVKALDVRTGALRWEYRLLTPPWSGVMATAGGLVFGSSNEGNLFALDAETGQSLWDMQAGAPARSNPISFELDGRQRVAMSAGNVLFVLSLP